MHIFLTVGSKNGVEFDSGKLKPLKFSKQLKRYSLSLVFFLSCVVGVVSAAEPNDTASAETTSAVPGDGPQQCDENPDGCQSGPGDVGTTPFSLLPGTGVGNPINLMTGNKFQSEQDFSIPDSQLMFNRMYNSNTTDVDVGIGMGWRHSYSVSIVDTGDGGREVIQSNGSRVAFNADGTDDSGFPIMRAAQSSHGYLIQKENRHTWHMPDGRVLSFIGSFLVNIRWPDQRMLKLYYRSERLESVTDETGRNIVFAYTERRASGLSTFQQSRFQTVPGLLESITLPDGSVIGYDYDENRNLSRVRFSDGTNREYHFEDETYQNHLTGLTDRTGIRFATWAYDEYGRGILSEYAEGFRKVQLDYPELSDVYAGGNVQTIVTNSLGQESIYTWRQFNEHSQPQLLSSEGAGCTTCPSTGFAYSYDEVGRLITKTRNSRGTTAGVGDTRYVYDDQGRISEVWRSDELGWERLSERYEYKDNSAQSFRHYTPSVNPDKNQVTETEHDERGLPIKITQRGFAPQVDNTGATTGYTPIERSTHFEYDEGRLLRIDGPREDVDDSISFEWDTQNRITKITPPDGPPMRITKFDSFGRALTFVKGFAAGRSSSPVSVTYNNANRIQSVTQSGRTLRMHYDAEGRVTGIVNRVGREMVLRYGDAGQLVSVEYVGGQSFTREYNDEGRIVEENLIDRYGDMIRSVSTLYDAQGRIASVSRNATVAGIAGINSSVLDYEHDSHNRPIRAVDRASGGSIELDYNAFGDLAGFTGPNDNSIAVGYDAARNSTSLSDSRDNKTQFIQDDFGQVISVVSADVGTSVYEYDAAGNRLRWMNPAGATVSYSWDAANRPVRITSVDGDTLFSYDKHTGLLAETSNSNAIERFSYDNDARLLRHERIIDSRSFVTEHRYDKVGRLIGKDLPDGQSLKYHYYQDGALLGQLRAITRSTMFGLKQEVLLAEIDEDHSDGVSGYIGHNGKRTTRTHASDGRVTRIEVSDTLTLAYRYDSIGRIIGIEENGVNQSYAYSNGLLSAANTLTGSYLFDYDDAGNRTGKSVLLPDGQRSRMQYQYSENRFGNRLLAETTVEEKSSTPLDFNSSGSPLTRGSRRYEYNSDQRPTRVYEHNRLIAEYAYNSFGERIKKVTYRNDQKSVTYFLYDGHQLSAEIPADDTSSKSQIAHTIYLQGKPVVHLLAKSAYAVHTDKLGTPFFLSDAYGAIAWQAEYSPFGKANVLVDDISFKHRFPGQYEDTETGTHYNYLRDYDPETGRYLTSDPISLAGGLNTYLYANADPLNSVDVLGLQPELQSIGGSSGTLIDSETYDRLQGYAVANDGAAYFSLLHDLTGHFLFKDFADSYSLSFTPASIFLLREVFLHNGLHDVQHVMCSLDGTPIYEIPEVGLFSELVFQRAGVQRAAVSFVVEGGTGLLHLGAGTVNFVLDSTLGLYFDAFRFLFPNTDYPEWYPSYAGAVDTVDNVLNMATMVAQHPHLIWDALTESTVQAWAQGRYAEASTGVVLEIASLFTGAGAVARVARAADLLKAAKIADVDPAHAGEFNKVLDKLIDEFRGDPDKLREAAEEVGLLDEVVARMATRVFGNVPDRVPNSNGIDISPTPGQTTTIIGSFGPDMDNIINNVLEYPKTEDFGPKPGGFNVLNVPDDRYDPATFWENFNIPWLDQAVARGDRIVVATRPTDDVMYRLNDEGDRVLTGFGNEIKHLESLGYRYNPNTGAMEPQ